MAIATDNKLFSWNQALAPDCQSGTKFLSRVSMLCDWCQFSYLCAYPLNLPMGLCLFDDVNGLQKCGPEHSEVGGNNLWWKDKLFIDIHQHLPTPGYIRQPILLFRKQNCWLYLCLLDECFSFLSFWMNAIGLSMLGIPEGIKLFVIRVVLIASTSPLSTWLWCLMYLYHNKSEVSRFFLEK